MAYGTAVQFDSIRERTFGSIGATYAAVGGAFAFHGRIICISNSCDVEVYISFDGVNDHLRLARNSFKLYDFSTNKIRDDGLFMAVGTIVSVRRVSGAPTSGAVWVEVMHAAASGGV